MVVSGCIGPRGDGYDPGALMSAEEARDYHAWQIGIFREADADCVSAFTMTNVNEATGVARAAQAADMPSVISFTLETDGRLPTGESPRRGDRSRGSCDRQCPAYYMINCAHPTHFADALDAGAPGRSGCARCGRTRRAKATPSSTIRRSSTPAIRRSSARNMPTCCAASRTSTCSAAAAAQTIGTSLASAKPAAVMPTSWRRCRSGAKAVDSAHHR